MEQVIQSIAQQGPSLAIMMVVYYYQRQDKQTLFERLFDMQLKNTEGMHEMKTAIIQLSDTIREIRNK
jgi:hypothetical protein